MIRVAAVGDVHFGTDSRGTLEPALTQLPEVADLLLLAGDLTRFGTVEEAKTLAQDLADLPVPCAAVLGNHDHHCGAADEVVGLLEDAGVRVLEGEQTVFEVCGRRVGIAGTKGFGGGFARASGSEFGEREMKIFMRHTRESAETLGSALSSLGDSQVDARIALLHYAPIPDTVSGERPEIYPFLGSYLLGEAIDASGADLVLHGHAHHGVERGITAGGIPVRNVAEPVLGRAFAVYKLGLLENLSDNE